MDFLSRLIGGVGPSTTRKTSTNDPQHRLSRFKKAYDQTLQVWHKLSPSRPDPVAVDTVRTCLQRLTTLLHDDTRAPVPHLCLSFAASSQFYLTVARIALSLNNEEIVREAVAWFNALVDNDEENLLNDERFAEALMNFAENISSPNGIAAGSQTEGEILELMFGIAAKIRLEPELLPIWFMSEDQSSTVTSAAGTPGLGLGDHKRFPLCYQFVGRVYHEGRAGDFARTGLLYIFESVSHSPELERWIIESDLPTLMASGLGALYSQLSRKLDISHPVQNMPLILALSHEDTKQIPDDVDSFYSDELQGRLSTFMSNLIFWQDILEHCRSLEIKQTLIDHFQVFFLQQILYPSLLESSDIDGGSSVAVLTYLWRILESVEHPDLMNLILQYLLALSTPLSSEPITPRSLAVENRRKSLLSLAQLDGGDEKLNPSFFNLTDLILASVTSKNAETLTAALRLISTLLIKHHPHAYSSLFRVTPNRLDSAPRIYGALHRDMNDYYSLVHRLGGGLGIDEAYENCVKDALSLIESHACSAARLGMTKGGSALESRHRSAILENQSRSVQAHHFNPDDPLLSALMALTKTFFTNDIETNLGLTNVIAHIAACPYTGLEGWMVADPHRYRFQLCNTTPLSTDGIKATESHASTPELVEQDPEKAEEARIGAFHATCRVPEWSSQNSPELLKILSYLAEQLEAVRPTVPNLDHLLASRKRAFSGLDEMEREPRVPLSTTRTPLDSARPSRDASRARIIRPDSAMSNATIQDGAHRGRSITTVANLQKPDASSPARPVTSSQPPSISRPVSPTKLNGANLSASPQPNRTLSPLAAVVSSNQGEQQQPLSARSRSSIRSAEAQVLDRKLRFPVSRTKESSAGAAGQQSREAQGTDHDEIKPEEDETQEASLTHVLTNIVILQEFILELMALIQVRCSLLDGEVKFQ